MSTTSLPARLKQRLMAALADTNLGADLYAALVAAVNVKPATGWFAIAAKDDYAAGTATVWAWANGGPFGRVCVEQDGTLAHVHAHVEVAHSAGTMQLELWRNRGQGFGAGSSPGTMTLIGSVSVGNTENDGATIGFTLTDTAVEAGDYLHLQPVGTRPTGSGWFTYVDVHFDEVST